MDRFWFAFIIGAGGLAILIALCVWQIQRLEWKQQLLAGIEARIAADPVPLSTVPDPEKDRYLPVSLNGRFDPSTRARMLASRRQIGAVHRHIAVFDSEQIGRVLVDIGWTEDDITPKALPEGRLRIVGNLDWPNEADGFTPDPDMANDFWFARNVPAMAQAYDTQDILVVLRDPTEPALDTTPWPVDTAGIPNDHLQYAITWFSLALVWVGMTALFVLRTRTKQKES